MRTLVIGAGPVGLEAATSADLAGATTLVVDAGAIGAGLRTWGANHGWSEWAEWTGPAGRSVLGRPPSGRPTGQQIVTGWLEPLAARLEVQTHTRVFGVAPSGDGFRVALETTDGERRFEEVDEIFDAAGAGAWGAVGEDGLPVPSENRAASAGRLRYGPVDPDDLPSGEILVVGSGDAAGVVLADIGARRRVHHAGPAHWRTAIASRLQGIEWVRHSAVTRFGRSAEGVVVFAGEERFHVDQVVACCQQHQDLGWIRAMPWSLSHPGRVLTIHHPRYHLLGARSAANP